ncbi:MAG: hypothetical protein MUC49_18720 [Raineya sp.]|jgi:hypothetical protein|nr:hypothetical protein [Raineya sp.]
MKRSFIYLFFIALMAISCKEAKVVEPLTLSETIQKMWRIKSVQVTENGLPADDITIYNGFTMEFVGEKYYVSNGNDAFPNPQGLWGFNDPNLTSIEFDGGIIATVTKFNASELNFTFTRKGSTVNGRIPDRIFTFELVAFK